MNWRSLASKRWVEVVVAAVVVTGCLAATHARRLPDTFHERYYEERAFEQHNRRFVHSPLDCFTAPSYYPGLYRPLTTSLYYYLGHLLWRDRPEAYKVVNYVFLIANGVLLFLLCRRFVALAWALVAAALFASRRAHLGVVLISVEFQTLLAVFYSLWMLYFFIRARREGRSSFEVLSYICFVMALLSKEPSVAMVVVVLAWGRLFDDKWKWEPYLTHVGIAALWAVWFFFIYRGGGGRMLEVHYSFAPGDVAHAYLLYLLDFSNHLLAPTLGHVVNFGMWIDRISSSASAQAALAAGVVVSVGVMVFHEKLTFARARDIRFLVLGFVFFLATMAPYAVLGDRTLIRYSYIGHLGLAMCCAAVLSLVVGLAIDLVRARLPERASE
jgi:hypothetical protein